MNPPRLSSLDLAMLCSRTLDAKKAGDIRVLDVSELSSITDFLVVATATSGPHLRALRVELELALDAAKAHIVGMDAVQDSGWSVIDAFDVMIHLFTAEMREQYRIEALWKDADDVSMSKLVVEPKRKKKAAKKPAKKAAKKKTVAKRRKTRK